MNNYIPLLKERRKTLQQEIINLTNQLNTKKYDYNLHNEIQKMGYNAQGNRNGLYGDVYNLSDYESKWQESFFIKHRLIAEKYASFDLSQKSIAKAKMIHFQRPLRDEHEYTYLRVVTYCEAVLSTNTGPVLKLSDPYGSILTEPLNNTSFDEAVTWIDRILVAKIGFSYKKDKYPLEGFKMLKFTLYNDLRI